VSSVGRVVATHGVAGVGELRCCGRKRKARLAMAGVKWCLMCATANPKQHKQALWMVDGDLMCQACRDAAPAGSKIVRLNANGEIDRKFPVATDPAPRRAETAAPRPYTLTGPKCAHPDCERRLRSDNSTGRCSAHSNWRAAGAAVATMTDFGQVAAKMAAAGYVAPAKVWELYT